MEGFRRKEPRWEEESDSLKVEDAAASLRLGGSLLATPMPPPSP